VSRLVGGSDCQVALLSLVSQKGRFWIEDEEYFLESIGDEALARCQERVGPCLQSACETLIEGGLAPENVSRQIEATDAERAPHIVKWATRNGCDTIVLGRRGLVSFLDALFVGRISDKVLDLADELAVWVV
jgi:nucleotide-binding universal stress UspA family protein